MADLLRGDFKRSEDAKVILPLVVIRRLDCVLADTRAEVVERAAQLAGKVDNPDAALQAVADREFYNTSPLDFAKLTADPANVATNLGEYIGGSRPGRSTGSRDFASTPRSPAWPKPTCSTRWWPGSRTSTCTPTRSTTTRWATSTRS